MYSGTSGSERIWKEKGKICRQYVMGLFIIPNLGPAGFKVSDFKFHCLGVAWSRNDLCH